MIEIHRVPLRGDAALVIFLYPSPDDGWCRLQYLLQVGEEAHRISETDARTLLLAAGR